jgi:hypothetical protein
MMRWIWILTPKTSEADLWVMRIKNKTRITMKKRRKMIRLELFLKKKMFLIVRKRKN